MDREALDKLAEKYAFGQCYPMALALREVVDWPVRCLMAEWKHHANARHSMVHIVHVFLVAPDGGCLDARGMTDMDGIEEYFIRNATRHVCGHWTRDFDTSEAAREFMLETYCGGEPTEGDRREFSGFMEPMVSEARIAVEALGLVDIASGHEATKAEERQWTIA